MPGPQPIEAGEPTQKLSVGDAEEKLSFMDAMRALARSMPRRGMGEEKLHQDFGAKVEASFGDGSVEGIIAKVADRASKIQAGFPAAVRGTMAAILNTTLQHFLTGARADAKEAFAALVANSPMAGIAGPLIGAVNSGVPPPPSMMYDWMAAQFAGANAAPEVVNHLISMAALHKSVPPDAAPPVVNPGVVTNLTGQLQRRFAPAMQAAMLPRFSEVSGRWKETHDHTRPCFALPCKGENYTCFKLCIEYHIHSKSPKITNGVWSYPPPFAELGFTVVVMAKGILNEFVFNVWPDERRFVASKYAYDLSKWRPGPKELDKTLITAKLDLRESFIPICMFTGSKTLTDPMYFERPVLQVVLKGSEPSNKMVVALHTRTGRNDHRDFFQWIYAPVAFVRNSFLGASFERKVLPCTGWTDYRRWVFDVFGPLWRGGPRREDVEGYPVALPWKPAKPAKPAMPQSDVGHVWGARTVAETSPADLVPARDEDVEGPVAHPQVWVAPGATIQWVPPWMVPPQAPPLPAAPGASSFVAAAPVQR